MINNAKPVSIEFRNCSKNTDYVIYYVVTNEFPRKYIYNSTQVFEREAMSYVDFASIM